MPLRRMNLPGYLNGFRRKSFCGVGRRRCRRLFLYFSWSKHDIRWPQCSYLQFSTIGSSDLCTLPNAAFHQYAGGRRIKRSLFACENSKLSMALPQPPQMVSAGSSPDSRIRYRVWYCPVIPTLYPAAKYAQQRIVSD